MKACKNCNELKSLKEYYRHTQMADGHVNVCKDCSKEAIRNRAKAKAADPVWVEKERARQREKYKRLGYKEKQKEWDKKRPWTQSATYKNLSRYFKTEKGTELHHWSYKDEHLKDVYVMCPNNHAKGHTFITIDVEAKQYRSDIGELLDTKQKHFAYLKSKGIEFLSYSAVKI